MNLSSTYRGTIYCLVLKTLQYFKISRPKAFTALDLEHETWADLVIALTTCGTISKCIMLVKHTIPYR